MDAKFLDWGPNWFLGLFNSVGDNCGDIWSIVASIINFINDNNTMYMIWHYDKCIQFYKRKMFYNFNPTFLGNFPNFGQHHSTICDITEPTYSIFGANGYKIGGIPPIIPMLQSGGCNAVFIVEFIHL
ncbi:MAG: hypothetical protein QY315_11580 [Saprospiraceae bacterium]|nr:MAG: hypothetical protein QY315_11580 [Saprospiraceae bacterium]